MTPQRSLVLRQFFAGASAAIILFCVIATLIAADGNPLAAGPMFLSFVPLALAPAAIYYFKVTHPKYALICGLILFGLTAPTWTLLMTLGDPFEFYVLVVLIITLASSSIGAAKSRAAADASQGWAG